MKEMSCVKNLYVLYVYCYIVVACIFFFLTVATFPATYIRQLGRSLQKNEKLVTVCLSRPNFALIHLSQRNTPASKKYTRLKEIHPPQRNTPAYGTHHLCVAISTIKHILTTQSKTPMILLLQQWVLPIRGMSPHWLTKEQSK
jgi:hypothetical protein